MKLSAQPSPSGWKFGYRFSISLGEEAHAFDLHAFADTRFISNFLNSTVCN
jgi:hypothetical protein